MHFDRKGPRKYSLKEKDELIEAYTQGTLTQRDFAISHGIGYSTLTRWLRGKGRAKGVKNQTAGWIELRPDQSPPSSVDQRLILESPSGWRIHLSGEANLSFTAQLMELCSR